MRGILMLNRNTILLIHLNFIHKQSLNLLHSPQTDQYYLNYQDYRSVKLNFIENFFLILST